MADTILIKAGNKSTMPSLRDREIAYCKDEKALYIGTTGGNVKLCDPEELSKKLTANAAAAQSSIADGAELPDVITAFNGLIAALKAAGIMSN